MCGGIGSYERYSTLIVFILSSRCCFIVRADIFRAGRDWWEYCLWLVDLCGVWSWKWYISQWFTVECLL